MENTGSYWKPVYNIFEEEQIPIMVVNAQHIKVVPGRKTDVKDAEWIANLVRHGLVKASYIPNWDIIWFQNYTDGIRSVDWFVRYNDGHIGRSVYYPEYQDA